MKHFNALRFCLVLLVLLGLNLSSFAHRSQNYSVFNNGIRIDEPTLQLDLQQQQVWKSFEARNGNWFASFDVLTKMPIRAAGPAISINEIGDNATLARHFIANELKGFDFPIQDLKLQKVISTQKYSYVKFIQLYKGLEVLYSRTNVYMPLPNTVSGFTADVHKNIELEVIPSINETVIATYAKQGLQGSFNEVTDVTLKVLPIPTPEGYTYKLVYEMMVTGTETWDVPGQYYTLIDAHDGTVYYRYNKVHTVDVGVKADVVGNPNFASETVDVAHMDFNIGPNTYVSNANGVVNYTPPPFFPTAQAATGNLEGPYCKVHNVAFSNPVVDYDFTYNPGDTEIVIPNSVDESARSAFYNVNRIHDFMKSWTLPAFNYMDVPMSVRVNATDGTCNAYYDGSLNFLAQGGGCYSSALFNDICYHEYGHGITYDYYAFLGASWNNGALGEGYADVWALGVTENPILSQGFFIGNMNSNIRRYDIDPKVYPEDLVGEVHADGEIIAGAWWDLGQAIGMNEMYQIFIDTWVPTPMRPDGQEGALYSDILFEALLANDDNGNLMDGTPYSNEIIDNFDLHGISLQIVGDVSHNEFPLTAAAVSTTIDYTLNIDFNYSAFINTIGLWYRTSNDEPYVYAEGYNSVANQYFSVVPAQEIGTVVDYYIEVTNSLGGIPFSSPYKANLNDDPNIPYHMLIGYDEKLYEDFSGSASGWSIGAADDDASTGEWMIGTPNATYSNDFLVQPDVDASPTSDNRCAFTGNSSDGQAGTNDVDDGKTTLTTPPFNMMQYEDPAISFMQWFSNDKGANPGNDYFEVFITNDGSDWVRIQNNKVTDNSGYRLFAAKVRDYVELSTTVQVRFVASDNLIPSLEYEGGSLVEAVIDDFKVYDVVSALGLETNAMNTSLEVYPNPATEVLYINQTDAFSGVVKVQLYTLTGQEVFVQDEVSLHQTNYSLPLNTISEGMYLLKVSNANGVQQQKIMVK